MDGVDVAYVLNKVLSATSDSIDQKIILLSILTF